MINRVRILFLCRDHACLSPMAEGWARLLQADCLEPASAGIDPAPVDPLATRVMAESGINIHRRPARTVDWLRTAAPFDYVVALHAEAHRQLPALAGAPRVLFLNLSDPRLIAHGRHDNARGPARQLERYRQTRDDIREFIESLPAGLAAITDRYHWVPPEFLKPGHPDTEGSLPVRLLRPSASGLARTVAAATAAAAEAKAEVRRA